MESSQYKKSLLSNVWHSHETMTSSITDKTKATPNYATGHIKPE
jgi:hypothetical protein